MPKTREQKAETLERLKQAFQTGKSVAFADYQGMDVKNITDLRKKMREEDVEYIVAKKTLLSNSAKEAGYDVDFSELEGMISVAFAHGDEMAPMKIIGDAGKAMPIKLIGGIFDGAIVDARYVNELSALPSKSQLLTQLLHMLNGPTGAFVRLLNAHREKQEAESGIPETKAEEAPKAEPVAEAAVPEAVPETQPEPVKDNSSEEPAESAS